MAYEKQVIDHFENPRNVGTLDKDDPDVGTGLVGAPACITGDTLVAVKVEAAAQITNQEIVEELSLPPVKVHCSVLAEDAIKAAINDWQKKNNSK